MSQIKLTPVQRKAHRADAHHLDAVVHIGNDGLSAAVIKEVDAALNAHGLIKVRAMNDERTTRAEWLDTLAEQLGAAPIQHIGKLLVLWRPMPEKEREADEERRPGPRTVKVLKYSTRGGQRPEVKQIRLLGNERLTKGGTVKRVKPKTKSLKRGPGI